MGQVLVVRHAAAEPREEAPDGTDWGRRLTQQGEQAMRRAAAGLHWLLGEIPVMAHSPLTRAMQTALLLEAAGGAEPARHELSALAPGGDPQAVFAWLASAPSGTVALVGHEPDLSRWVGLALTGEPFACVAMKKSAACLLEFPAMPAAGQACLSGHFPPRVLRALAEVPR
ncbi:MAG: SixA phosphatase family protein [Halorhodospira sp.]